MAYRNKYCVVLCGFNVDDVDGKGVCKRTMYIWTMLKLQGRALSVKNLFGLNFDVLPTL